jgi:phenylalanyl-tRNA synthetase alpha chain
MSIRILSADELRRVLAIRDLSDPSQGPHAMQLLVERVTARLVSSWGAELRIRRGSPIVSVGDNYDRLGYRADAVTRDVRYTRYVCDVALLRTHTSALVPAALRESVGSKDVLIACPGIVYRRDSIDRLHSGEPHQLDLWRVRRGEPLELADLSEMIDSVVGALLPGVKHRTLETSHPYTVCGRQIDVEIDGRWIEIGECGLASPKLLHDCGHARDVTGLAMGIGLDRSLMLAKGIDDIRLLRASDPRVAAQMLDLSCYRPVSDQPAVSRDLSIVTSGDTNEEELGDAVRAALGVRAASVESIAILAQTAYGELPQRAVERLGMAPGQKNVLVRIVLRDLDRTLTSEEANRLRDEIYAAIHAGPHWEWACRHSR